MADSGRRLRVLLVGNFFQSGSGAQSVCADLADALRGAGCGVIRTSTHRARAMRLADMVATAWRRRGEYDVAQVDVYSGLAFTWADAVSRVLARAGKPHVLSLHGGALPELAARRPEPVRRLLRRADAVTAPSRYLQDALHPYAPAGIRLIPNPVRVSALPVRHRSRLEPRLLWLRAFHDVYDPQLAVAVAASVRRGWPGLALTMAGPDKGDGSLAGARRAAERLGVADCVTFPGPVDRDGVRALLADADLFLNTARVDNTPISVLEALAAGLPIVTTNVGGLPFLLEDGVNALLVPPGDAAAMSAAVDRLLADPRLAARLSSNGRETALRFDWSRVLPEWLQLLHATADHTTARPAQAVA